MNLTNRDLEKAFGKSLVQIKRWAGLCLGTDPLAGQGSGVRREYDQDSAFIIYLFGVVLVGEFHLELKEAKIHIDKITPVLREYGILPSKYDPGDQLSGFFPSALIESAAKHRALIGDSYSFPPLGAIDLTIMPKYKYLLERSIYNYVGTINGNEEYIVTTYRQHFPKGLPSETGPHYYIPLIVHIKTFNRLIEQAI